MNNEISSPDDETPEYPLPSPTNPLSPGLATVNPDDEEGIEQLSDVEGEGAFEPDDDSGVDPERTREQTDTAVLDGEPDPL
ncbi:MULTISPECIES: hypothetical protein [unclassified Pseudomonas]|uniref:hypothetical protein n=1 Tax=unclassified Pseudomonas TaxID=196821 RepID=UPI002AC987BC|nr:MULTISPECIES: hypothetical protein [unclassified Pseudomonas]MEB0039833.1 hypothetical protein [Pseudomonas sp. MH10]MEB0120682.1 hypothetical protein [Pseudomonas sp. CCI1.2]WPX64572.1 hypothetical protein RHM59_02430 [Pseudomonas sp. MH10]